MNKTIRLLTALIGLYIFPQALAQVAVSEAWHHPVSGDFYALPTNPDSANRAPTIHVSDTNGQSWTRLPGISDGAGGEIATTTFAIIPDAGGDILLAGTAADGLFRSTDNGTTWTVWNDAAIGIETISVAAQSAEAAWVVASDGAVYVSLDDGANWTLVAGIAGKNVSAIVNSGGDMAWVGTSAGELFELSSGGTTVTDLTGSSPFAGEIEALARTMDGTLYMAVDTGDPDGAHLYRTSSAELTSFEEIQKDGASLHVRGLAGDGDAVHLLEFRETATTSGDGELLDYLVTNDAGASWNEELFNAIIVNQLYVGPCEACDPWVFVAHTEGLYLKSRGGIGWTVLRDVEEPYEEPPPPPPELTDADLGVRMVSPTATQVTDSTERYTLEIRNFGPDDVSDITVEIEFATWVDDGTLIVSPENSYGKSATIAGNDCEQGYNSYAEPMLLCKLDTLANGATATIVLVQELVSNTIKLRIDAEFGTDNNRDNQSANDWVAYEASVVAGSTGGSTGGGPGGGDSGGGGGGSFGLLGLLTLLVGRTRRLRLS